MAEMNEILDIDPDSLTLGELCDIQDATGENAIDSIAEGGQPSLKLITGFVWIIKRRQDPTFTFEQAREFKIGDIVGVKDPDA